MSFQQYPLLHLFYIISLVTWFDEGRYNKRFVQPLVPITEPPAPQQQHGNKRYPWILQTVAMLYLFDFYLMSILLTYQQGNIHTHNMKQNVQSLRVLVSKNSISFSSYLFCLFFFSFYSHFFNFFDITVTKPGGKPLWTEDTANHAVKEFCTKLSINYIFH